MNDIMEKPNERLNASRLSHPVTGRAAVSSRPMSGRRDTAAFWVAEGFLCGDTEPLPSMFTSKMKASKAGPRPARTDRAHLASLARRLSKWHISNKAASYIIASFFVLFAAADGVLLKASTFSADRRALARQASAALDQDGIETAMVFSAPAFETAEGPQAQGASPEGEQWSSAVGTLGQLLASKKASQAAAVKQAENEQLLKRLEAWVNARTQKPAVLAGACVAPAGQCWKGAALIQ